MMIKKNILWAIIIIFISSAFSTSKAYALSKVETENSRQVKASSFGIQFNGMPFHENTRYENLNVEQHLSEMPVLLTKAAELGVKWARISVDWSSVEDNKGVLHWEILDAMIYGLVKQDIEIYLCLHGGHKLYTGFRPPVSFSELEAWRNWVRKIVNRYHNEIKYWEVWNEPNGVWFWNKNPDAKQYLNLVKATRDIILENDNDALIIGGSIARLDLPFAKELFDLGIADYIDVFTFHPYSAYPEAILNKVTIPAATPNWYLPVDHSVLELMELISNSGKDIELWQGECGYPSAMNSKGWNGTGPWSDTVQCKWIIRRALTDLSFGAKVSCYFLLKEFGTQERKNSKGLLDLNLKEKPAFTVYQNVISTLTGSFTPVTVMNTDIQIIDTGSFKGIQKKNIFETKIVNDIQKYYAFWAVTRMQDSVDNATVEIKIPKDEFRNPVLIDLLHNDVIQIETKDSGDSLILLNLPLADYPFLITSE